MARKPPQQPKRQRIDGADVRAAREEAVRQISARDRRATIVELINAMARPRTLSTTWPGRSPRHALHLERCEIDRHPIAPQGEKLETAIRRILLERGASTRQVARLTTEKVNDSKALQAAKRSKQDRIKTLTDELADIDSKLALHTRLNEGEIGRSWAPSTRPLLEARRAEAQAALDRLMFDRRR